VRIGHLKNRGNIVKSGIKNRRKKDPGWFIIATPNTDVTTQTVKIISDMGGGEYA